MRSNESYLHSSVKFTDWDEMKDYEGWVIAQMGELLTVQIAGNDARVINVRDVIDDWGIGDETFEKMTSWYVQEDV